MCTVGKDIWGTLSFLQLVFTLGLYTYPSSNLGFIPTVGSVSAFILSYPISLRNRAPFDELHHFPLVSVKKANVSG